MWLGLGYLSPRRCSAPVTPGGRMCAQRARLGGAACLGRVGWGFCVGQAMVVMWPALGVSMHAEG